MGGGDLAPPAADGYKVNVPESMAGKVDADVLAKDEGFKGMLGKLHAAGASQKVVDVAVAELLERGAALREAAPMLDAAECTATLKQQDGWKTDQEYQAKVGAAFSAAKQIFGTDFEGVLKDFGNDPRFIRGMAAIGAEMQEDRGPSPEAQAQLQQNADQLMASPAYLNQNDPKHAETVARVTALTQQLHGNKAVASGKTVSFQSS